LLTEKRAASAARGDRAGRKLAGEDLLAEFLVDVDAQQRSGIGHPVDPITLVIYHVNLPALP